MRDEVIAFGQAMETRMRAFDEKKGEDGWKSLDTPEALLGRMHAKMDSLEKANAEYQIARSRMVPRTDLEPLRQKVLQVAADVGNYAMLVADVCGALPITMVFPAGEPPRAATTSLKPGQALDITVGDVGEDTTVKR